jgi:hypothetical protein
MKKLFNEENQVYNFMSSSDSGTVINYGSGSDFLTSYGSGYGSGSGSTSQKVTVPTVPVPVPVPQHWNCGRDLAELWMRSSRVVDRSSRGVKGSLTRDFRLQVFFMNQCPPDPRVFSWGRVDFFRKFAEIFAKEWLLLVSTMPAINLLAGDNDTGDKFESDSVK